MRESHECVCAGFFCTLRACQCPRSVVFETEAVRVDALVLQIEHRTRERRCALRGMSEGRADDQRVRSVRGQANKLELPEPRGLGSETSSYS